MSPIPNPLIAAGIGHWLSRRNKRKENRPLAGKKDSEHSLDKLDSGSFEIMLSVFHTYLALAMM